MKRFSKTLVPILLTALVVMPLGVGYAVASEPGLSIAGQGSTGPGGYDLTVAAVATPFGVSGNAALVGGVTGPIVQVVPPSTPGDCWCLNVQREDTGPAAGNQKANIYIRDSGDGVQTFDQISFVSGIGIDCGFPKENLFFHTIAQGDFKAGVIDADGDGVIDDLDQCPATPAGSVVNEQGCSIDQLVPCSGRIPGQSWKNHGEYVTALNKAVTLFLAAGIITQDQAVLILEAGARSDCGKK